MRAVLAALCLMAGAARAQQGDEASPGLISVSGFVLFYGTKAPLSFVTMTRKDLPAGAVILGEVKGRGCQHGLSVPITTSLRGPSLSGAMGNGGYERALQDIRRTHPELTGIFDVKVDYHTLSILGIYRRLCTEVTARGFK